MYTVYRREIGSNIERGGAKSIIYGEDTLLYFLRIRASPTKLNPDETGHIPPRLRLYTCIA